MAEIYDFKDFAVKTTGEGGVTVVCKVCGDVEIVREESLCDVWKLCSRCARKRIDMWLKWRGRGHEHGSS